MYFNGDFSMYRIVGQPVNIRRIYKIGVLESELSEQEQKIIKIVEFGLRYGYKAAVEAFELSKSSYYNYVKLYKASQENGCKIEIKSKRPNNIRKANWDGRIVKFICNMRKDHANIGKDKIKPHLDKYCHIKGIKPISSGTIQNIINSFPNKLRTKKSLIRAKRRENVLRKPSNYKAGASGECVSLDSMEFRRDGRKLYVVVVQDEATNLMYARATNSHASHSTTEILEAAYNYLPWDKFNTILTDNGSEFQKDFAKYVKQNNITHYRTYPSTPKQNARCERVNRTIQDEFMIKYENLLFDDINLFNKQLDKYLRWYNFERVHARFNNTITPFQRHRQLVQNGIINV